MITSLSIGSIFDAKYKVLEVAGSGGMGTVFKVLRIDLGRTVALKIVNPGLISDSDTMGRFEREAVILSNLLHPNIGRFYKFGISPEKIPYIEMEFIDGPSLREVLNENDSMDWRRALQITEQSCAAMEYAHKSGVYHRDLKPNNIILCAEGASERVKVVDFGLAKLIARDDRELQKLTQTGTLIGSVQYMSPELCSGAAVDHRTDIYSLGCVLFECITGRLPHESDNSIGLMHKHVHEPIQKPSLLLASKLPDKLDDVILKAVERDVKLRYQFMVEFRTDLLSILGGELPENTGTGARLSGSDSASLKSTKLTPSQMLLIVLSCVLFSSIVAIYYFFFSSKGLQQAYQLVAPNLSKNDKEAYENFFLQRMEKVGSEVDLEQARSLLFLEKKPSLERASLCLKFAKMELSRKEDRRAYSWAKKALADLVQLTDPDEIEKIKNLLKQYAEIMIALPDSYLKQQEIRSVLSSKMRVRPERFDSTTFRELCILSDIADDHYDWALSRLADLCQAQVRAGDIKDALRNIKRGEALLAKIKNAGGSSEFEFRLAEVSVYSMDGKPDLLRSKLQVAMDKFLRSDWSMAYTQLVDSGFKTGQWEMTLGFIVKCLALAKTDSEKYYDLEPAIIQLSNPGAPFYLNSWCISRLRKLSATTFGNTKDYAALLTHYGLVRLTQRAERQENQFLLSEIERLFRMNLPIASIGELNNLGFYTAYRLGDKNKANVFDKDIHTWSLSHPEQSRQSFAYYFHRASFLEMHKDRDGAVAARIDSIKYVQDPLDRILALALLLNLLVESKDHRMDIYDLKLSDELSKQKPSKFFPLSYRIRSLVAAAKKDSARREDLLLKAEEAAAKFGVSDEQALSLWLLAEFYSKSQRDNEYLSTLRKGCLVTPVSIYEPYISFRLALASSLFLKGDFRGMEKVVNEASAATRPSDYYYQALVHCYRAQLKRGTGHSIDAEKYAQEAVKLTENRLNNKRDLGLYLMALSVLGKAQYQSGKKIESEKSCRRIVELSGAAPDAIESIYEARMILCDLLKERGLTANAEKELAQIKYDASKIKQPDLKAQVEKFIREHRPPGKDGSV